MRAAYIFLILGLLMVPVVNAGHTINFHAHGECPPDGKAHLKCIHLDGEIVITQSVQICQTYTFDVDPKYQTMFCMVTCKGTEVYRKRYEFPGTGMKAVPGYPYDIFRGGNLSNGTLINDTANVTLRKASDCGNGDIDTGEACDTSGNKGCNDPLKPTCYRCMYCGCSDVRQCVQITGPMRCGTYGCSPWEIPKFSVKCLDGVCAYPRKCNMDPNCLDKYQEERDKKVESKKQSYAVSSELTSDQDLSAAVMYEKFQGKTPHVPLDAMGGTISDALSKGETQTYVIDGQSFNVGIDDVSDMVDFTVNGREYDVGEGETVDIGSGAELYVYSISAPTIGPEAAIYFHINTVDEDDMRYIMYSGDYDGDTGEITWPPKEEEEPWTPTQDSTIDPPFWLPPGKEAHLVCSELNSCTWEEGKGEDECHHSEDCTEERMRELNETGEEEEPVTVETEEPKYHGVCSSGGYCIRAAGAGADECMSDGDCWDGKELPEADDPNDNRHTACQDKRCIYVEGEGQDECFGHWDCDSSYPLPATRQKTCFGTICRLEDPEMPSGGRICRTDIDCGGKALFGSLVGTDLEQDATVASPFRELLGNERVNFYAGDEMAFVALDDGVVADSGDGELEDNSVNVITDIGTIEDIEMGEKTVIEAYDDGSIRIEGEGFFNGIRFWLLELFYNMGRASAGPTDA